MGIVFRAAGVHDASALAALAEELGYPVAPEGLAARLARLAASAGHLVLVAESEDALVAWLHVQEFHSLSADPSALVTGLIVTRDMRRMGLGRALLERAEDWARERGLGTMRLRSRLERREAHVFYERLGYRETKRQVQLRKDL